MENVETKQKWLGMLLVAPAFLLIIVTIAIPIIQSVVLSFHAEGHAGVTLVNYKNLFNDPNSVENIVYTLKIVILTVILTVFVSYLLGFYITFRKSRFTEFIEELYLLPRFVPGVVAIYAMMVIIKDTGALNRFLLNFGINFKPGLMYTPAGITMMNMWFNVPFATMLIGSALAGIPVSQIESAKDIGAGSFQIFKKIIFPLSAKTALIAATFVFMGNIGSFTTPFLMGANAPRMLGVALFQQFNSFYNLSQAAALSVFMFTLCAIFGIFYMRASVKKEKWNAGN